MNGKKLIFLKSENVSKDKVIAIIPKRTPWCRFVKLKPSKIPTQREEHNVTKGAV
jgi:hypothetical protein